MKTVPIPRPPTTIEYFFRLVRERIRQDFEALGGRFHRCDGVVEWSVEMGYFGHCRSCGRLMSAYELHQGRGLPL